jgi:hypothetical protein
VEHGIDPQHCIACSGVIIPPQSNAYAARTAASAAIRIVLLTRIIATLGFFARLSQAGIAWLFAMSIMMTFAAVTFGVFGS